MEKITKLNIQLLEHKVVEKVFEKDLPDFKIVYNAFSDSWSFVSKNIKHSLYYNSKKKSKLISEKNREFKELIILNTIVYIIFGVLIYLKHENDWDIDFFWAMIVVLMIVNSIVVKSKSGFKDELENDHAQLVDYFSKFHAKN